MRESDEVLSLIGIQTEPSQQEIFGAIVSSVLFSFCVQVLQKRS